VIVSQPKSAYRAKIDGDWHAHAAEIAQLGSLLALADWQKDFILRRARGLPEGWAALILEACDDRRAELSASAALHEMDRHIGQIARGE